MASFEFGPWWVLWIWGHSWLVLTPKVLQPCVNQLVYWFCAVLLEWVNCLSLFLIPSRSSSTPLYPSKVLKAGNVFRAPNLSIVSILGLSLSLPRGLGVHQSSIRGGWGYCVQHGIRSSQNLQIRELEVKIQTSGLIQKLCVHALKLYI